jgi:alcohol dehydrogenase class IV
MAETYKHPTRQIVRNGALADLPSEVDRFKPETILLVVGKESFRKSIHFNNLQKYMVGYDLSHIISVGDNPTEQFLQTIWTQQKTQTYDLVIGIGGGSVLDFGKTIAALLTQPCGTVSEFLSNQMKFEKDTIPFIAIPTTAGTGSEVTQYASIETEDKQKISLTDIKLFPALAIVDPELTHSMPPYLTACTGFDAICQAIESYWSVSNSETSEPHALKAIPILIKNLIRATQNPNNKDARFQMAYASLEAGLAIAQTRTTAVHSVSYPMTTYFDVPHGHACSLTLAPFIRFNAPAIKGARGEKLYQAMGVSSADNGAQLVEDLMKKVKLEQSLTKLGIDTSGIQTIIQNGFRPDRVKNNPRHLTPEDLKTILESIA